MNSTNPLIEGGGGGTPEGNRRQQTAGSYRSAQGKVGEGSPRRPRGPDEHPQEGERTASSAEYEATCGPKGGEGKGYENPAQDHEECGGPKEMKWGGEGS